MKGFLFRLVITGLGLWAAETVVPGVRLDGWGNLVVAALLLGIVNAVIRPIILILTLPLTVLTLGLFILVVNGISLSLVAWVLPGFHIGDRKSTRLNSSHGYISYAVFCLKKKKRILDYRFMTPYTYYTSPHTL